MYGFRTRAGTNSVEESDGGVVDDGDVLRSDLLAELAFDDRLAVKDVVGLGVVPQCSVNQETGNGWRTTGIFPEGALRALSSATALLAAFSVKSFELIWSRSSNPTCSEKRSCAIWRTVPSTAVMAVPKAVRNVSCSISVPAVLQMVSRVHKSR